MKLTLIAVAVFAAAPALAQTTPSTMQSDPNQSTAMPQSTGSSMPMGQSSTMPDQGTSGGQSMGGQSIGDQSTTGSSMSGGSSMGGGSSIAGGSASGDYPMCSRSVRDHCRERSNSAGARMHSTPRG